MATDSFGIHHAFGERVRHEHSLFPSFAMADVLSGAEASGNEAPRLPPRAARGKRQRNDRDIEHAQAARDVARSQSSDDAGALVSMLMTDLNTAHREHMAECGVDAQVETKTSNPNDAGSETEDKEADRSSEPLGKRSLQYECTGTYCWLHCVLRMRWG